MAVETVPNVATEIEEIFVSQTKLYNSLLYNLEIGLYTCSPNQDHFSPNTDGFPV